MHFHIAWVLRNTTCKCPKLLCSILNVDGTTHQVVDPRGRSAPPGRGRQVTRSSSFVDAGLLVPQRPESPSPVASRRHVYKWQCAQHPHENVELVADARRAQVWEEPRCHISKVLPVARHPVPPAPYTGQVGQP